MRIARLLHRLGIGLAVLVLGSPEAAAADAVLEGRYRGTGPAAGAVVEIAPDPGGFEGRFTAADGSAQDFLADRVADMAEAVLDLEERVWLMQLQPRPFGAEMVLVPIRESGEADIASGRILRFLGQGKDRVAYPEGYAGEPLGLDGRIAANTFLASYPWWRPAGVVAGYAALAPEYRTLIRLFPAVQLDLIWRMCLAPGDTGPALAMALRGEPVGCAEVVPVLAAAQSERRYGAYLAEVSREAELLRTQVRCADNYIMPGDVCTQAARRVAAAATRLETTASVLARYR